MSEQYLSVGQVNNYIKNIFEAEVMLQNICIYGEVSSYKISNNIAYFNLTDETGLISCVLFNASRFPEPNIGDVILAVGSISYYAKGGKLSFNANHIAPYGKGLLYEKFLKLKEDLEKRGYFKLEHKKPIPERVNKIGVVTSSTGAVIQDIINVTKRRNKTVNIVLYPVKVQGVGAETEIANGINFFSNYDVDAIIVARGGGSAEDLQPFNTEIVATATYNCKKPIVSAVGHETDFTIIDFVSDLRAPTPSAAAECVVNLLDDDINQIDAYLNFFYDAVSNKLIRIEKDSNSLIDKMFYASKNKVLEIDNLINQFNVQINHSILNKTTNITHSVDVLKNRLEALNPYVPLKKGYVKVESDGMVVRSHKQVKKNKEYNLIFSDGKSKVVGV